MTPTTNEIVNMTYDTTTKEIVDVSKFITISGCGTDGSCSLTNADDPNTCGSSSQPSSIKLKSSTQPVKVEVSR